ncbi:MAG: TetR/AcrR family transcriptional regulator [Cyanobacteria bacterium J06638_22]
MPKIVDSDEYRKKLLRKAFDLLAEKGYSKVTTRQLSRELGISTGAMYHYFPSKQALFEHMVEELCRQDVIALQEQVAAGDTLADRLKRLGQFLIDNETYLVKQITVWVDFCTNVEADEILNSGVLEQVEERYWDTVAQALNLDDRTLVRFIWTMISGVVLEQVGGCSRINFAEQIHLLVDMLTVYLEARLPKESSSKKG